ncbi:MAG: ribonuclease III [Aggregatilineales bacterium]
MTDKNTKLNDFQQILDLQFTNPALLRRALTHPSFANEADDAIRDNERLEFLGDAILDFLIAAMLFERFPDISEGDMTQLRSALVRADSLAQLATNVNLGNFLLMGRGEEKSGGRERINNLCRGFEALIGAMYVDSGLDAVRAFALPRFIELLDYILENSLHLDARSILQERSQAELFFTPVYHLNDVLGPLHEQEFIVDVMIVDEIIGTGHGNNKRAAAQDAARVALEILEDKGWSEAATSAAKTHQQMSNAAKLSDEIPENLPEKPASDKKKRLPEFKARKKRPRKIQRKSGKKTPDGDNPIKRHKK